ncbi:tyrosine-protein phosphatase [Microbacterium capsulatum]|uniref:Tyrosine-protein phosphatase n=1 Tax=Microbacterium capsulatum TaxID=3041921 RepID=A0ABU0XB32_9MICO|nr:tyrosine-protein phosphatase [Microbacterium sp. ASV81]MDQ4212318.1 tyrosine-protein phosphatase [Microbacterium sp. ASV81]
MTVLHVPGITNLRDVGGIPVGGSRIREGVLFRSGNLAHTGAEAQSFLRGHVSRVVDLRDDSEVLAEPCGVAGIPITHVPLFAGSIASFLLGDISLDGLYRRIVDDGSDRVVRVMDVIAAGEPTLVHCTLGKDRTGVSVALALAAVGADRDAIVEDYALTASQLPESRNRAIAKWLEERLPVAQNAIALATESPAPVMRRLLAEIDQRHGSVADYLLGAGLAPARLEALGQALVE